MVGEGVLHVALGQPDVESVVVIGRKACGVKHDKLKEIIHNNFYDYFSIEKDLTGFNACFFCLGVSSIGMKEMDYTRTTFDLTMQAAATLSRLNRGMTFCYVSGAGTDSTEHGGPMWARVKGRTENQLMKLPFKAAYMFRPGFIKPIKGLGRAYTASKVFGLIYPALEALFPKYVCTLDDLGISMIRTVRMGYSNPILENKDITKLARTTLR